jgi:hypothetical protein
LQEVLFRSGIRCQQFFGLAPQLFISAAGLIEKSPPLALLQPPGGVANLFEFFPSFGTHRFFNTSLIV